ncbi:unnamed protein product [Bemisia tabaci]|uniref:Exportin-2 central domain-containing protein n=2 Tax=Bemisia tabaci TaxID=7038 RepID=A0A9P0A2V9_BEMTA|nr:unnamed protein product [Bemisia tabaci]
MDERAPLNEAMNLLLPYNLELISRLLPDQSEQSVLLQKQILKVFFALTQYVLPMDLLTKPVLSNWMQVFLRVLEAPVPEEVNSRDEDERPELPWWKCKKWAIHILHRLFERYGSPGNVSKEYNEFAQWYLKTFSVGVLEVLLKILELYRQKIYIAPRVMQLCLNYVDQGIIHAHSWSFLKCHMFTIIRDIVFPLLCYSEADDELWHADPHEYIRLKFDIFEDFVSPVMAAQTLLHSACKKRKNMLQKSIDLILEVLNSPNAGAPQKDGALHMIGSIADILLKKPMYKDKMDEMLARYVFPEFSNPKGHMRARACWVLHYFSEIKFKQDEAILEATRLVVNAVLKDEELPVKVEAAIALQMFLNSQDKCEKLIEPQIKEITMELLRIIRVTENDDLTNVMHKIVCTYNERLIPIAVEMCQHMVTTLLQVINSEEGSDEKSIMIMGLLNTLENLLNVMENNQLIMSQLEPIVIQVVACIFTQKQKEFYEEALCLVFVLTNKAISPDLWKVLELMYSIFEDEGIDYFLDMMPSLHNYITVDTQAFLSNEIYLLAMFNICKSVLSSDAGEDPECHAAKLLEVIILQCKGKIDQCIPSFVELVLQRLMREVKTSELRTMCLQVVIAALYYNPVLLFETFATLQATMPATESIASHFIKQWIHDTDCFLGLHDRKLCVLGLCTILAMAPNRPPALNECADKIVPSLILLFDGLKRAYAAKYAESDEESDSDLDEDDDSDYVEVLSSDEDEIDEEGNQYLETLEKKINKSAADKDMNITTAIMSDDDSDDSDDEDYTPPEETALESYTTPLDTDDYAIDEYVTFKEVLLGLQQNDPGWYGALTSHLSTEQQKALQEIMTLADQRKAAAESKRIEQSGGYSFVNQTVPTSFNFGGQPLGR